MKTGKITASVIRPNTTTQYTAGDVLGDALGTRLTFSNLGVGSKIEYAIITDSIVASTKPDLELWLFDADVTGTADNAAFGITDADLLNLIGIITFPVASVKVGGANCAFVQPNLSIITRTATIYGVLVIRNAYDPTALEVFQVVLGVNAG